MAGTSSMQREAYSADGLDEGLLMSIYWAYRREAEEARLSRIQQNKVNYDTFHMRQDFSHKQKGQSMEFLPKLSMAIERNANTLQQGLVDIGDWFRVYPSPGWTEDKMKVKPDEIRKILAWQLEKASFMKFVGDSVKIGYLGALMVAKMHGNYKPKVKFEVENKKQKDGSYAKKVVKVEDKKWQLAVDLVRQQDWRPDPTNIDGIYNMEDTYIDWYQLDKIAKDMKLGFDREAIQDLKAQSSLQSTLQEYEKSRETGQNLHNTNFRHRIKVSYLFGDFVAPDGTLVWENCVCAVANDHRVIMKPQPIGFWHGEDPYISTPIMTVPESVWGKTPADAGALLNIAINELFNLILDGGLAAVHGIKQIREHWLEDPSQVEDGIPAGETLRANSSCPVGAQVLERVDTTTLPPEALPVLNTINQEFNVAMMTDDLREGVQPFREVKATQIVENSQAITSMATGIAKHIEADYVKPILIKAWLTCAQHLHEMDHDELIGVLGEARAAAILNMGAHELFVETAQAAKFEVFGISATMAKQKTHQSLMMMLQTVAASPVLMEQFVKTYDFNKLLTQLLETGDVPIYKIQSDDALNGPQTAKAGPSGVVPSVPNMQSQIPQASSQAAQTAGSPASQAQPIQGPQFPGSPALAGQSQVK